MGCTNVTATGNKSVNSVVIAPMYTIKYHFSAIPRTRTPISFNCGINYGRRSGVQAAAASCIPLFGAPAGLNTQMAETPFFVANPGNRQDLSTGMAAKV
jgi:hypothetical protein